MTRVALTVDTECEVCGGTGWGTYEITGDYEWTQMTRQICLCVRPATIQDAGGHATLGPAGGMQAPNTPPSPCPRCDGRGWLAVEHETCHLCNGCGDDVSGDPPGNTRP